MSVQDRQYASTAYYKEPGQTAWTGWVSFAGIMLGLVAVFQGIAGLTALFKDEVFVVPKSGLTISVDYTAWGWVHLGIALLLLIAAISLLGGGMYGRIVGVLAASLSAIVNIVFIAAYPVWSVVMIAIDVLVIYAIVVHGRELKGDSPARP